jgi:hypothetical protein
MHARGQQVKSLSELVGAGKTREDILPNKNISGGEGFLVGGYNGSRRR